MSVAGWWLIAVGAALVVVALGWLLHQPRRRGSPYEHVEQFQRFCRAMEKETSRPHPGSRQTPLTRGAE